MRKVNYPKKFDAEKAKLCNNDQVFSRKGRIRIAEAQAFLDVWTAQRRVGPRGADDCHGKM